MLGVKPCYGETSSEKGPCRVRIRHSKGEAVGVWGQGRGTGVGMWGTVKFPDG